MIELRLFGTPFIQRVETMGSAPIHLQSKSLALLAYLALAGPDRVRRRDSVIAVFWPEYEETRARNSLSQSLHKIRRALGSEVVVKRGAEEIGVDRKILWSDVVAFDEALADGHFEDALDLYRGALMTGFHVDGSSDFEHWLETENERFRRQASRAAAALAEGSEASGHPSEAVTWLRRMLDIAPENEEALRRLLLLLDRQGKRTEALRAYAQFVGRLERELGLAPAAKTRDLRDRIRDRLDSTSTASPAVPSVAVLPFSNLSPDPDQEYFCDGITEELIHALAGVEGISVVARTTVFALKGQSFDVRDVAARIGADAVLEGSVRRAGGRLRISAQLINASDGYHLWSERYDRPIDDAFAVQDEIAHSIASTLGEELVESPTSRRHSRVHVRQAEAHTMYLKGVFHRRKRTPEDLRQAAAYFEEATRQDPDYAEGFAALAYTFALGGWFVYDAFPPRDAYPKAREAAEQALALNDRLAEAHVALGYTAWAFEWNRTAGEQALRRALEIDPLNHIALGQYSSFLAAAGRVQEALDLVQQVERLEPFWIGPKIYKGVWQLFAKEFDRAIELLIQAENLDNRVPHAPLFLGDAYRFSGRLEEADDAYARSLELMGRRPLILGRIGMLRTAQGRPGDARQILEELETLSKDRPVLPSIPAMIHWGLGRRDEAATWFARAVQERDTSITLVDGYPEYSEVRTDPRIAKLMADTKR